MRMIRILVSLATGAMLINSIIAANYTVGVPNGGWDTSTDLTAWTSSKSFLPGDNLIFLYTPSHDVLEVTKPNYDSCLSSNPLQTYVGGNTVIPLASPVNRYFICGTSGHCDAGMKVEIKTITISAPPPASPATPPPAEAPATPPRAPTMSPPPSSNPPTSPLSPGFPPPPPPSSATKINMLAGSIMAFSYVMIMLLTL